MSGFEIPALTRERQDLASRPRASAWVSANAGSGKTFVLSRRVVRLLLDGTDPSRILCLTFTKAAAAEMATRVFKLLGDWVSMDADRLSAELEGIEGRRPDAERMKVARRLFARALETPGGLKIQTIHAFCEALLHQFPLEANVAGHFSVLDDRIADELMADARGSVLHQAEIEPESPLGAALAMVIGLMPDGTAQKALDELISDRDALRRWLGEAGGLVPALSQLHADFGVPSGVRLGDIDARFKTETLLDNETVKAFAEALNLGGKTDQGKAAALLAAVRIDDPHTWRETWLPVFFKKDLTPPKSLVTKKIASDFPQVLEKMEAEQARLMALIDQRRTVVTLEGTRALLTLADAVIRHYEAAKLGRGLLDFEDLVVRTANLLSRSDAAQWVQYKLDQGLDHILVDEAQDTSPRQWDVVTSLAEEFFSGDGARQTTRTIFAVGDEKQSIYSFQGAVPAYFDEMRRSFAKKSGQAGREFHSVDLQLSFRSTPDVLGAVDTVFADPLVHKGLSQELKAPVHEAIRRDPGTVDIWPLEVPEETEVPEDWTTPVDAVGSGSPMMRVAARIAETIAGWIAAGKAGPGDVLILVRKRGPFVEALNRELKRRDIPAAGSDRLVLTDHIAVKDLVALGRFLLLAEDDLSLANVLKSPLFDLDDDDLLTIAREEPEKLRPGTLWQMLVKRSDDDEKWLKIRKTLEVWRDRADFMPPHEFYARLLSVDGGRQGFRARLGVEVDDVLDEFLALTMAFEQTGTPGMEGFLAWLAAAPTEIKRELTNTKGMVRIMTVHGSKGLEARHVILVDPGGAPVSARHDPAFLKRPVGADPLAAPALVWMPVKDDRTAWHGDALGVIRDAQEEEYRRLLYVALTRAEDSLVVCGWAPKTGAHERCWHALVSLALCPSAEEIRDSSGTLISFRWQRTAGEGSEGPAAGPAAGDTPVAETGQAPEWLMQPVTPLPRKRRLQPSKAFEDMELKEGPQQPLAETGLKAVSQPDSWPLERGRLMHRMLEVLPDVPVPDRQAAAERFVDAALAEPFMSFRDTLLAEAAGVMEHPEFAPLFAKGARTEVPIVGNVKTESGEEIAVSGQIDRLVVTQDRVLIVDYKTNLRPPPTKAEVPADYLAQLAVYRALLQKIYPDREVAAGLLWTVIPALQILPGKLLDETFEKVVRDTARA